MLKHYNLSIIPPIKTLNIKEIWNLLVLGTSLIESKYGKTNITIL